MTRPTSAHGNAGIPFSYAQDQQSLRLLELPPEVLELVLCEKAPVLSLKAKSAQSAASTVLEPAHAVLCTANKTYQLRQVQTSNSVFLVQPTTPTTEDDSVKPSLCAFSTCTSTLELLPLEASSDVRIKSAREWLVSLLPDYKLDQPPKDAHSIVQGKDKTIADIPLSDGECEAAWLDLTAFELDGESNRPSPEMLLKLWETLLLNSTAQGIDLLNTFSIHLLWQGIQEAGYPKPLFNATIQRLDPFRENENAEVSNGLNRHECILWVGQALAENRHLGGEASDAEPFLGKWRAALPESWQQHVTTAMSKLLEERLGTRVASFTDDRKPVVSPQKVATTANRPPGKRDWHEKFKAQRR